jgi:hypothetical protein
VQPPGTRTFEVRAEFAGGAVVSRGAFRERRAAEGGLRQAERSTGSEARRLWVEEIDSSGLYGVPTRPAPRDRYTTRVEVIKHPGAWDTVRVEVMDGERVVAEYRRDYRMLQTFEPFRQGDRMFALVSPHYTATSVLDLSSGEIVAAEEPRPNGFCPAGFYIPDWWNLHGDLTALPGSLDWKPPDHEWPAGDFGFVFGCYWGDDWSWKVEHLDLRAVSAGIIRREERYGYVSLASSKTLSPRDCIRCLSIGGRRQVHFTMTQMYDLDSGAVIHPFD